MINPRLTYAYSVGLVTPRVAAASLDPRVSVALAAVPAVVAVLTGLATLRMLYRLSDPEDRAEDSAGTRREFLFGLGAVLGPVLLNRFHDSSVIQLRRVIIVGFFAAALGWLANASEEKFWWSHAADAVMYRFSMPYRQLVRTHVIKQLADRYLWPGGTNPVNRLLREVTHQVDR